MLLGLIVVGLISKSHIITTSACILLVLKLSNLQMLFPVLERRGLELGLLFLMISVLVPFASGQVSTRDLMSNFLTLPGIMALLGGALATYMNGQGLDMLKIDPQLVIGLVVGSIIGIVFFQGIPVGPLMPAGLAALFIKIVDMLR